MALERVHMGMIMWKHGVIFPPILQIHLPMNLGMG